MELQQQIDKERQELEGAVARAIELARKLGANEAECAISKQTGISVASRQAEVESIEFNHDGALGITLYKDQRKGSSSTSDLSEEAIAQAVRAALDIAEYTSADPCAGLADSSRLATEFKDLQLCHPLDMDPDDALEQAIACEKVALSDPRIKASDGANYNSHYGIRIYGNSNGFLHGYSSSRHSLSCVLIAEQDGMMERDYGYTMARDVSDLWTPDQVAEEAVSKTLARLGGRKIETGSYPVLFKNDVAGSLMGHLVSAIGGGNLYRKSSFLLDHLGQQIFPEGFNVRENPHLVKGLASANYDSEGVATVARDIISDGVLQTYLLTSYSARKLGLESTGHAGGIYNWFVDGNGMDLAAMCREMGTGLLVTELMGQGVNIVTGDYSRGAAGFWVENGVIAYPVDEVTIAGNLRQMFQDIVAVGSDHDPHTSMHIGSTLIREMKVAGM